MSSGFASAVDAQCRRRVDLKPFRLDLLAAAQTLPIGSAVQPPQGSIDASDLGRSPLLGRLRHRLALQRVHARQPADTLLVESNRPAAFGALFPQRHQLGAPGGKGGADRIVIRHGVDDSRCGVARRSGAGAMLTDLVRLEPECPL